MFKKIIIFLIPFFFALPAFGAELSFVSEKQTFAQNEEFLVSVFLNTEGESLNAFEGKLVFPADMLEKKELRDGNSLINFWVERPTVKDSAIVFSGITPGGFSGTNGFLFSIVFGTKQSGNGTIQGKDLRFLKNDGFGTETPARASSFLFSVSAESVPSLPVSPIKDGEPPEDFTPIVSRDSNIFDGQFFLVFVAQDKGSGIDRYLVSEDGGISFVPAESPHLLKNQSLDAKIIVKAVDRSGNEKNAEIQPKKGEKEKQNFFIFGILILSALIVFFYRKKLWKKHI
jgi:hypothetical protein